MQKPEKERLNLYLSSDLLKRLEFCADRYGISRAQLAVTLIGQGVAGIEKAFSLSDNLKESFKELNLPLDIQDDEIFPS